MKILNSDTLMSGICVYRVDRQFFNEFINYLGGCSEYFGTTSDGTDSDDEKIMYHQHAIEIRTLQSGILSHALLDQNKVLLQLSDGEQSALLYNLVSMLAPLPGLQETPLQEDPPVLSESGTYFCYPLIRSQFTQISGSITGLIEDLHSLLGADAPILSNLVQLLAGLESQSYLFQDSKTGRTMAAMVVAQDQMMDLFRALLSLTTISYGKIDFADTLPRTEQ